MSIRAWMAVIALAFVFGSITGWSVRIVSTGDRYVKPLIERHEAESSYLNKKTDQIVTEMKGVTHAKR